MVCRESREQTNKQPEPEHSALSASIKADSIIGKESRSCLGQSSQDFLFSRII